MQWENLTSADFAAAVKRTGVCIVAAGVIEKHGDHLPLGTDFLNGHRLACLAAEREEAVVFPPFYFGQIYEARCFPGTVTIKPALLLDILHAVFDEIGRNGFRKIIILNAHGGNWHLLQFLNQCSLWQEKPYYLYLHMPDLKEKMKGIVDTPAEIPSKHACEYETSISLANHAHLVKMDRVWGKPALPLNTLSHMPPMHTGIDWYADYPQHYAGDARKSTAEKGKALLRIQVDALAQFIAAVKKDEAVPALNREFFQRARDLL